MNSIKKTNVLYVFPSTLKKNFNNFYSPGFQIYRTFLKVRAHLFPHGAWGKKKALLLSYWYQVQAAQDGVGDILIGKFFDVGYFAACGLSPAYKRYVRTYVCMMYVCIYVYLFVYVCILYILLFIINFSCSRLLILIKIIYLFLHDN